MTDQSGEWHRLHPLSPLVRSGRAAVGVLAIVAISASGQFGPDGSHLYDWAVAVLVVLAAVVNWLVTRWKLDGATLRIETGLLRRDSRQLPVARIQAVDVVRPFLARALGLAELRVRLAGSSHADGRLAYLPEQAALDLRARLLAAHHGLDPATPEPGERILARVPNGRLVGSVAASPASLLAALLVAEVVAILVSPKVFAAVGSTFVVSLITLAPLVWRRIATEYGFTIAQSPDGIRIRRGLLGTVAETIPLRRVQAVRMVEPVLWRPLGWCRLEIDVAGSPGRDHADGSGRMRKTLLPVGYRQPAWELMRLVIGSGPPPLSRPPRRARRKAPLSYHFLAAGHDATTAMGVTGRAPQGHHLGAVGEGAERPDGHRPGAAGPVPGHCARGRGRAGGPGRVPGPARGRGRPARRGPGRAEPRRPAPGAGGRPRPALVIPAQSSAGPSAAPGEDPRGEDSFRQPEQHR